MATRVVRGFVCLSLLLALGLVPGCASGPPPTPTELGLAALEAGDWRLAKTHFAAALEANESNGVAWHGQARAQLAGRDPEAALASLGRLSKVEPTRFRDAALPTYQEALDRAARHRLDRDQSEAALQAVRALAKLEPARRGLPRLLGQTLLAEANRLRLRGRRDAAFALLKEACSVTPGTLEVWVGAAEILLEKRQGKKAIRLLEQARKQHPTAGSIRTLTLQAMRVR